VALVTACVAAGQGAKDEAKAEKRVLLRVSMPPAAHVWTQASRAREMTWSRDTWSRADLAWRLQ
jgi:hypothetical protein